MNKIDLQAMQQNDFQSFIAEHASVIEEIRLSAYALHAGVNQTYGNDKPYGFHLDMVAEGVRRYGYLVCASTADILPLLFGAYYHDSIEDARQTYNDVLRTARRFMDDAQARTATEIVYALTNDKGRTRAERAGENYYKGIRQTPYAPFVKLADRRANIAYSVANTTALNSRMRSVYAEELPHFLEAINANSTDPRLAIPSPMVDEVTGMIQQEPAQCNF